MQKLPSGVVVAGVCMGIKSVENIDQKTGQINNRLYVVLESDAANGVPGQKEYTEAEISRTLVDKGIPGRIAELRGKFIMLPAYVRGWSGRNGVGIAYNLSNSAPAYLHPIEQPKTDIKVA